MREYCEHHRAFGRHNHFGAPEGRHPFGHEHGRHRGRGDRLGRLFVHGDLRLVILNLIAEKPRHGYEIIKAIEDAVGGAYSPSPGTVYPTLTLLEEMGYVTVTAAEGSRKLHAIADQGRAYLEANRPALEALQARMVEARRLHGGEPAPQIVRAMENVRLALRLRLSRGTLDPAQIEAIATALDAAATAVERA